MTYRITGLQNVLRLAATTPWAITPDKLDEIADALAMRTGAATIEELQARAPFKKQDAPTSRVEGNVAVIPLYGSIMPRANMLTEFSGGTSVAQFVAQMQAAVDDPNIGAIVIDTDSPGGAVSGVPEAAEQMLAMRGAKPIVAVANHLMASAAYWLGAQADSIVAAPSADVGSVGVYMVHQDRSRQYANEGVSHTIVRAGEFKAEGLPFEPLSEAARAELQGRVNEAYAQFIGALAKGRRVSASVVEAKYGKGRVLSAERALDAGMVDRVATLDSVIGGLLGSSPKNTRTTRRADDSTPPVQADVSDTLALHADALAPLASAPSAGSTDALTISSTEPAPQAEETPVENPTQAPTGAVASVPSRESALANLAALRPEFAPRLAAWINDGTTYQAAQAEVMAGMPTPNTITSSTAASAVIVGTQRETLAPWESLGHFAAAVAKAGTPGVRASENDPRLYAAVTGLNQASPSDGGFAVPGQFNNSLWEGLFSDATSILSATDNYDVDGEFIEMLAVDDTTRATGSVFGGVTAKWLNEGGQIDNSKPKFRKMRLEPQELAAMVYATEKLVNNSPVALGQFIDRSMRGAIALKVNEAIINGDGVGKPKGLRQSACKIAVAKESGQAAATITSRNIGAMKARRIASVANQYVWLANTDIQPELDNLSTIVKNVAGTENVGGYASPVYNPETNRLGGMPVIWNDHCETLGSEGDLVLTYLPAYAVGLRRAGVKSAQSMHLRFDYAELAFRAMFDIDGQSWLNSVLTPAKGSTKSTIITLAVRA